MKNHKRKKVALALGIMLAVMLLVPVAATAAPNDRCTEQGTLVHHSSGTGCSLAVTHVFNGQPGTETTYTYNGSTCTGDAYYYFDVATGHKLTIQGGTQGNDKIYLRVNENPNSTAVWVRDFDIINDSISLMGVPGTRIIEVVADTENDTHFTLQGKVNDENIIIYAEIYTKEAQPVGQVAARILQASTTPVLVAQQPQSATYQKSSTAIPTPTEPLYYQLVDVGGAEIAYQWYLNSVNGTTGGETIGLSNTGKQGSTYPSPPATEVGTKYYFCKARRVGYESEEFVSDVAVIEITPPAISCNVEPTVFIIEHNVKDSQHVTENGVYITLQVGVKLEGNCNLTGTAHGLDHPHGYTATYSVLKNDYFAADYQNIQWEEAPLTVTRTGANTYVFKKTIFVAREDLTTMKQGALTLMARLHKEGDTNNYVAQDYTTILLTRDAICSEVFSSVSFVPGAKTTELLPAYGTTEISYEATATKVSGDCEFPEGEHYPFTWSLNKETATWASIDRTTGVITVKNDKVPAGGAQMIVTAEVPSTGIEPLVARHQVWVQRDVNCSYVFTGISGSNMIVEEDVDTGTYSANYIGKCENPEHNHKIVEWDLEQAVEGITIRASNNQGLVRVAKDELATDTAYFTIKAVDETDKEVTAIFSATRRNKPSSTDDSENGASKGWDKVIEEILTAKSGSTVKADMGDNTEAPFTVWKALEGKNVTLEVSFTGGYKWSLNGKTIKDLPGYQIYIPLDVENVGSYEQVQKLTNKTDVAVLDLAHDGSFGADMKLTFNVGSDYAGKTLYLYQMNDSETELTYKSSAKADSTGKVTFPFTSASTYVVTSKAMSPEDGGASSGSSSSSSSSATGGGTIGNGNGGVISPILPSSPLPSSSSSSSINESDSDSGDSALSDLEDSLSESESLAESEPLEEDGEDEDGPKFPLIPVLLVAAAVVILAIVIFTRKRDDDDDDE